MAKLILNIFLIFTFLIVFVPVFRRFLFHLLVGRKMVREQRRANDTAQRNARNGKVNINSQPQNNSSTIKGGEYIDYEEVKDK